ncbi:MULTISPECIES: bifunctional riboflavin kinase/FAD synthetase [Micrococcus]|uniref:Riboflavin biosynthesis protein n=1 Tax=Micrococcus lylae TaxID=1273 RepID=A0ABY2JY66_9MICC|nr:MULTISPECIES: bifunctional riboflavin kinase/FAD synthetase [Micrococcus]PNL17627.1 bifunctional riboflavin kinase/FAD synthetase [Micrococcus sp. FDAARGOS_333]TFH98291.1 bifunctional riboflavin kinase/FAD synthetase [Micrococcus lylae]
MKLWTSLDQVPEDLPSTVVALGNFDGVHRGHRQVLASVVERARAGGHAAVVVTFAPHPRAVHLPHVAHEDIVSPRQRIALLEAAGVDAVLQQHYSLEFARQTPEEFVRSMFVDGLNAAAVVVGHDVRFGRDNSGDFDTMVQLGRAHGFEVIAVDEYPAALPEHPDRRCSSTWVREALAAGEVAEAAAVLGRNHVVSGEVVHGCARGRELGFPTANLAADSEGMIPADGVYAGWVRDGEDGVWPAAISVGTNPTFEGVSRVVEAHVIDRPDERVEDFDLYGKHIEVEFVARIRGMVAYEGVEKLVAQMHADVEQVRAILASS